MIFRYVAVEHCNERLKLKSVKIHSSFIVLLLLYQDEYNQSFKNNVCHAVIVLRAASVVIDCRQESGKAHTSNFYSFVGTPSHTILGQGPEGPFLSLDRPAI